MGKKLATIDCQTPVTIGIDDIKRKYIDYPKLRRFYEKMNFRKFLSELDPKAADSENQNDENEKVLMEYTELTKDDLAKVDAKEGDTIVFYLGMLGPNYHLADFVGFKRAKSATSVRR